MIRYLKVLLTTAVALAIFSALSAAANAAEEKFHCQVEPCTLTLNTDGTGATAHHVLVIKNAAGETGSYTSADLTGDATMPTKTTEEVTITGLKYDSPTANGAPVAVRMNECDYLFTSREGSTVAGATIHVQCVGLKHIEIELVETGCIFEVTPQTLRGAHYHNIGTSGTSSTEVTAEGRVPGIVIEVAKVGTGCIPKAKVGDVLSGEYTTGNSLVTAERHNTNKEMVEGWWA
jgi:hypothetical protein